jgi:Rhodopirellula transposase DDE domain
MQGRRWRPKGKADKVKVHDFLDKDLGKVAPYGVYDIEANAGWVSVGISHDTAEFAVNSIRTWWGRMGKKRYPEAEEIMITADSGGSNSNRSRLWKVSLQEFADETGLRIRVCHFPPGTSKWNTIEHRMFSFISKNWAGKPLVSTQTVVELIGTTKTKTGLIVRAALDKRKYRKGIKVTDEEMAGLKIRRARFHGDWNYTVLPRN